MKSQAKKVAVVTGASRGVGKGAALGLGEAGVTVYVTGRTAKNKSDVEKLGGTVYQTAEEVNEIGGKGIAISNVTIVTISKRKRFLNKLPKRANELIF